MYSGPKRRIEADEFVLRDASGSLRAALTMTADGPGLFLYDPSEVVRAGLLVSARHSPQPRSTHRQIGRRR